MSVTIDSLHIKVTTKFDALIDLTRFVGTIESEYSPELDELVVSISNLQRKYYDHSGHVLSKYWETGDDHLVLRNCFDEYEAILTSENFISSMDHYFSKIKKIITALSGNPEYMEHTQDVRDFVFISLDSDYLAPDNWINIVQLLMERFEANKITFIPKLRIINECECGSKMYVDHTASFKICETCGVEIYMPGMLYDESSTYNQQGQISKHKRYNPDKHCEKWVDQITATEDVSGPAFDKVIARLDQRAIKEFTKNGKLRSMKGMSCKQVREWLKEYKLTTKWNDHAPLIRKAITALHGEIVSPPNLTPEEREDIVADFSQDMYEYDEICKLDEVLHLVDRDKIKNKPYYPFGLFKVLCQKLKDDPRLFGLIECIHFQSMDTNVKNDKLYRIICQRRGKKYEPTNRTILIDIQ